MTNTDEARRAVQETIEQLGGIDIVLANAVCLFPSLFERNTLCIELLMRPGLDQVLRLEGSRGDERGRVG
jgi:NAD(P)-dependent dehydrogenase (short-subunit alcohol dehydrogenase family)